MTEKERLAEIYNLVEKKNLILETLIGLKNDCPDTFGNLEYYCRLLDEVERIDSALTKLGFYRRGKRL